MDTVQNEDQLAVVMGHEMAHAVLMHGVSIAFKYTQPDWVAKRVERPSHILEDRGI